MSELALIPSIDLFKEDEPEEVHRCGVFIEYEGLEAENAGAAPANAWCWSPAVGFHSAENPGERVKLILDRPGRIHTKQSVTAAEAVAIGAGLRVSDAASIGLVIGQTLHRLLAFTDEPYYWGEAEFWARFGRAAAGKSWIDEDPGQLHYITRLMVAGVLEVIPRMDCYDEYRRLLAGQITAADRERIHRSRRGTVIVAVLADGVTYTGVAAKSIELYLRSIDTPRAVEIERIINRVTVHLESLR